MARRTPPFNPQNAVDVMTAELVVLDAEIARLEHQLTLVHRSATHAINDRLRRLDASARARRGGIAHYSAMVA